MVSSAASAIGRRLSLFAVSAILCAGAARIAIACGLVLWLPTVDGQKPNAAWQTDLSPPNDEPAPAIELKVQFLLPDKMTWPAGVLPEIYTEDERERARSRWQSTQLRNGPDPYTKAVRPAGPNAFVFRVAETQKPFYLAIFAPGFIRFYEAGPFDAPVLQLLDGGFEYFRLPRPATLEIRFDPGKKVERISPLIARWSASCG